MISIILFTFWPEEENYIKPCLESAKWAEEIVVVDNGATEKTLKQISEYTSKIYHDSSKNFADRHNFGLKKSSGDWVFFLDADERISASLRDQIIKASQSKEHSSYKVNRANYFLGKKVRYGDRYPDTVQRLFQKSQLRGWKGEIHESSIVDGSVGNLSGDLYHLTHRNIFSMMEKTINFSEHEAHLRLEADHPVVTWWRFLRVIATEFYTRMIKYQGFRQGTEGWIDGLFQTFSLFIVYVRLWELQKKPSLEEIYQKLDEQIQREK